MALGAGRSRPLVDNAEVGSVTNPPSAIVVDPVPVADMMIVDDNGT